MAPHFSTLAWKIPWMEEPGGLQSMGSLRVGHDWATSLSLSWIGEGNGNPLQCSCLENPRDGGAWWAAIYGVAQSQTRLKRLSSSSSNMLLTGLSTSTLISAFGLFIRQQLERPFHNVKVFVDLLLCWPVTFKLTESSSQSLCSGCKANLPLLDFPALTPTTSPSLFILLQPHKLCWCSEKSNFRSFAHRVSSTWNALLLTVSWLPSSLCSGHYSSVV